MSISSGTRLGHYDVITLIGAGGMGQVYRAHDTKLGRDVALKVLPADTAADPERLERFQREANVLAALNHPNIGSIYASPGPMRVTRTPVQECPGVPTGLSRRQNRS